MFAWLAKLPAPILYAVSVAIEKSFALITIPLMATYLSPESYGYFDVAVVLSELVILVVGLGLTEQLIRFVSTASSDSAKARVTGEIMGCALWFAAFGTAISLLGAPTFKALLGLEVGLVALQFMLVAACMNNCIALPMAWLRLRDDAQGYVKVVVSRTLCQVAGIALALTQGFGADGVLISNGVVLCGFSLWLGARQARVTPIRLSLPRFFQVGSYGAPLLGAMLAMFFLSSASRLFLAPSVDPETMGQFSLASRLALATGLLLYPLELWWMPKRIAVLTEQGGLERSADVWGVGLAIILLSATGVALIAPVFIAAFLPETFLGASLLLPLLVACQGLHCLSGLTEVGSYARETGYRVLAIDLSGAAAALGGFLLLIPLYGVYGAIAAVVLGQLVRICGYVVDGKGLAPIRYRWGGLAVSACVAGMLVGFAPAASDYLASFIWAVFSALALLLVVVLSGLVRLAALSGIWSEQRASSAA